MRVARVRVGRREIGDHPRGSPRSRGTNSDDEANEIAIRDPAGCGRHAPGPLVRRAVRGRSGALELKKGDRIILIGNTLAERMQYFGHFETLLHARFPELELVVHNLG